MAVTTVSKNEAVVAPPSPILTNLIPVQELAPGQIAAIKNEAIKALLAMASAQLQMSVDNLVVRDIMPYTDLKWGTDATTGLAKSALTTDIWYLQTDDSLTGYLPLVTSASTTMGDQKFCAIWGLRDARGAEATVVDQTTSLWKFDIGHSIKAIWDVSKLYAYRYNSYGICPSPVIIPQNVYYQIYGYSILVNVMSWLMLDGCIVEPRGKQVSP